MIRWLSHSVCVCVCVGGPEGGAAGLCAPGTDGHTDHCWAEERHLSTKQTEREAARTGSALQLTEIKRDSSRERDDTSRVIFSFFRSSMDLHTDARQERDPPASPPERH